MWGSGSFQCVYMLWISRAINCYRKEKKKSVKIKSEAQAAVAWVWEENGVQGETEREKLVPYIVEVDGKVTELAERYWEELGSKSQHCQKGRLRPQFQIHVSFGDVMCNTLQPFHMWFSLSQLSSLLYPFIISCILSSFPIFSSSCPLPFGPLLWINACSEMLL